MFFRVLSTRIDLNWLKKDLTINYYWEGKVTQAIMPDIEVAVQIVPAFELLLFPAGEFALSRVFCSRYHPLKVSGFLLIYLHI